MKDPYANVEKITLENGIDLFFAPGKKRLITRTLLQIYTLEH